ncbi:MAG: hypothetical protein GTO63_31525 [Anaerolineae bacterium]|nr:hypothetical protein [Anaerolineae bacterium]NIN99222.1 hypothetical protein [Anaerolineae bacterium]
MDAFTEFLRENRDMNTMVLTPGGNHGDTLIHMGLVKRLDEQGFRYSCFNLEKAYKRSLALGGKYLLNIFFWKTDRDRRRLQATRRTRGH